MTSRKMSERKFTRGLGKPGMAAQIRETVSQAVRETTVLNKPNLVEPIDFESFILKNKTLIQNDPQRELLLYPSDDVSQVVLPRRYRTTTHSVPSNLDTTECNLFTKECLRSYTSNWNLIHYKYSAYSGTYLELPKILKTDELKDEVYEVDTDADQLDEEVFPKSEGITKQGFLMKGPEVGSDRMFVNLGSKSFKRRYCYLRQEVDGTYILELHKDEKKGEAKATIVMDFCTEVIRNPKRGRFCFELRMTAGHKSFSLAAESEVEMTDWVAKLNAVLQHNRQQEEKRSASLERANNTPPPSPQPLQMYGTLKGLEQSMNPQLMKYARETDASIAIARRENRRRLFSLYPHIPAVKVGNSPSLEQSVDPYREQFGQRLLVRCESIRFRLQAPISGEKESLCQVEPYLTSLALFDAKQGRKLTENFLFDVNHSQVRELLPSPLSTDNSAVLNSLAAELQQVPQEWLLYPKQAVLSLSSPHPDVFVVVRIDKVLQGGICQTTEPYIRSTKDPRLGLRVHKNVKACCQRLGHYRMPFAWTARPLFRLYSNELDTSSDFPAVYRQEGSRLKDEELLKILSEYRKPDKLSRLTVIPGWLKIKIEAITELPENTLTSSLMPLKPFPLPPSGEPTLEVNEFEGSSEKDVHPYTTFVNHLYVYPISLNFDTQKTFTRARNIACSLELRDSDAADTQPLYCIYGRPGGPLLVQRATCSVVHHSTSPCWYEEVKLRLPISLNAKHHLLFTFYHVSCDQSKKPSQNGVESCVGYAWLPLLHKGRLNVEEQVLPVATSLPAGYLAVQPLGLGKGNAGPEISWIDSQRPIFTVGFQLLSTVVTTDLHLHNLFTHTERLLGPKHAANAPSELETCKVLKAAHAIQLSSAITFFPTLLNQLLALLVMTTSEEVGQNVLRVLIHIIHMLHEAGRKDILQAYVKFVLVPPDVTKASTIHEEMSRHLPALLKPANTDFLVVHKFMQHAGFFFDTMVKSMAQYLLSTGRIKMHRNERFSPEFLQRIKNLMDVLFPYLSLKYKDSPVETQELNCSLAHFLKRCLTFMDRGFVFKLINSYMDTFTPGDSRMLSDYKFVFMQIICSHEHFIMLNLPLNARMTLKASSDFMDEYSLSVEFCRRHFLVGLLLQEVRAALHEVFQVRKAALSVLRDLLAKHELDDRYQNKGQLARIAAAYVPLLGIILENLPRLTPPSGEGANAGAGSNADFCNGSHISSSSTFLQSKDNASTGTPHSTHRLTMLLDGSPSVRASIHARDSSYFAAIAGQMMINGSSSISLESETSTMSGDGHSTVSQETAIIKEPKCDDGGTKDSNVKRHSRSLSMAQMPVRFDKLQSSEVKDLLLCFLFVVKHLGDESLVSWWQQCSEVEILSYFKGIEMCLHQFKYTGRRQIASRAGQVQGKPGTVKAMTLPARMQPPDFSSEAAVLASHTGSNSVGRDAAQHIVQESDSSKLYQALLEANVATEVGLIALDSLGLYCIHFKDTLLIGNGDNLVMRKLFDIYISFLQVGQSETLFRHVFAALRAFINNFSIALFQGNAVLCGRLCYELLRCCNSRLSTIRQESCALLYLLMRSNFEFTSRKGLTRVHLQVIISVSQMLGNIVGLNNARFQESLSLINSYASSDKVMKGTGFPGEVKDLTRRIRTVLMATAQMREHHQDPETLVDLQHSLANSYASTPELRHTWLETMARNHERDGNFSEAACCQLHIAALMAEYLKLRGSLSWGAEAFAKISSNIERDERGLKLDAGVQDVQYTELTLREQLERCAELLDKAERYELLGELFRLIIPMYERRHSYEMLAQCYQALANACTKVVEVTRSGKRLLGRYYRVAFYGQAYFEDESGAEYIYKEPKITSLSEISERLLQLYSDKLGQDSVRIIMDSAPIDPSELDPKLAHIQVTHVTPFFEKTELEDRQTEFQQSHDVSCFSFETPFTRDGKARGSPGAQWKRRTILTTLQSFPYVKKRIPVIKRRIQELSPIEVALDEMQLRVTELEDVVFSQPTDAKKLQLRLQGSVCVQVNAGPLAYAAAFLNPDQQQQYPEEKVEELKDIFREFVKICYMALQINAKHITSDQLEYQQLLRTNFQKLCRDLSNLFGESLWPDDEIGCFKRNSQALFSAISGAPGNSSTA